LLHILLVEDAASEREILATAFEHRGVKVSAARNDAEAYTTIRSDALDGIAAVVTDVNLGRGTTGFDVARAARAAKPDLAVVYMTAYEINTAPHEVPDCLTLRKPLRLTEVADVVLSYLQARDDVGSLGQGRIAGE
jgi:DNA-binding NtrC family response regulator